MDKKYNIAVVGATGLVGSTILKVLAEYDFPINNLKLLASKKSAGSVIKYQGKDYIVEELKYDSFTNVDIALFSAGGSISKEYANIAIEANAIVIDNSSTFRNDKLIPLVVVEVNAEDIKNHKLIANPNCSTIQSVLPIKALDNKYGVKRVVYTTYQATSGSGIKGIMDLKRTIKGENNEFYPYPIAKTCIPHIDEFLESGYTKEEMKMVNETRKILNLPNLNVSATCVRVPVENSHAVSIQIELEKNFNLDDVRDTLNKFPGIKVYDDFKNNLYPTSIHANDNDFVYVGRIRRDLSCDNGLLLYCVSDNVRKGAATNAVQIAKYIVDNKLV